MKLRFTSDSGLAWGSAARHSFSTCVVNMKYIDTIGDGLKPKPNICCGLSSLEFGKLYRAFPRGKERSVKMMMLMQ